jgi:hypothetical protein
LKHHINLVFIHWLDIIAKNIEDSFLCPRRKQKLSENNKEIKIMLDPQVQIELLKRTWDLAAIEASQYEDRSVQRERFIDVFDKTYTTLATILNKPLNS